MASAPGNSVPPEAFSAAEQVAIPSTDGRTLVGRLHRPNGEPTQAIALFGGVGVPARYFQDFAAWLSATLSAAVLTFDYRDFGWSQTKPLKQSDATFSVWGIRDQSAGLSFLSKLYPSIPLRVVGHSLGGQWLAFHEEIARVDRVVAVASGPVHWRDHPWHYMPLAMAFWWVVPPVPMVHRYLPGRAIGLGANLPAGVYWEWRKYCTTPGFHQPEWGKSLPMPLLDKARFDLSLVAVADDPMIPPWVVRKLPGLYPQARLTGETVIDRRALGLGRIGHHGAFAARNSSVWPLIAKPLMA